MVPGGQVVGGVPEIGATEVIGVAVAAVVLVVTFGSLVAAGMTLLTALLGVLAGMAGLFLVTAFVDVSSTAPILALMLGLAVGIDYALFISSRHRTSACRGHGSGGVGRPGDRDRGSAVLFAGATVVIALAGLSVVGVPFLTAMGLAAAATVLTAVLVALTLLPALLGFVGNRILPRKIRKAPTAAAGQGGLRLPLGPVRHPVPRPDRCPRHHRARVAGDPGQGHAARAAGRRFGRGRDATSGSPTT